jgi:hypothetical protein
MATALRSPFNDGSIPAAAREERQRELENLLRSGIVREKTQLHNLLEYLGRKSLEDPAGPLKEYVIGIEGLGKPEEYDPRLDPTVRVEVAKLRKRLAEYYAGAGSERRLRMTIPRGGYMPVFIENTPAPATTPEPRWRRSGLRIAVVILLFAVVALAWRISKKTYRVPHEIEAFWGAHFAAATPTLIVFGAPLFLKLDNNFLRDTHVNRPDALPASAMVNGVISALRPQEIRPIYHFTGMGEAEAIFHITRVLASGNAALDLKPSNAVGWDDLKNRHVVLIGGRKFNPQIPDLPVKPRFLAGKGKVTNLRPINGEPAEYATVRKTTHGDVNQDYAVISVHPGFGPNTRLVVLESASTEGTLAAAEFVTRPDTLRELIRRNLPIGRSGPVQAFQVVVGARLNDGVVIKLDYVTHAVLQ